MAQANHIEPRTNQFLELLETLEKHGISLSNADLRIITGVKSISTISEIKGRRQNIKPEAWEAFQTYITEKHPEISVPRETSESQKPIKETKSYLNQRREQKQENKLPDAPFMPVKAQAGYVKAVDHHTFMNQLERYPLPPGVDPHGHIWAWWEVDGDSMYPDYCGGDMLATSLVHPMDYENMKQHYGYVIVTNEQVLFKQVYHRNELEWVLQSVNEEMYPPTILPVEYIKEVWVMRAHVRRKMPQSKRLKLYEGDIEKNKYPKT